MSMVTAQCESLRTIANRLCDDYLFSGFEGARTRGQTIFLAASQMERAADTIENLQEELHHLQACWNFDPCPDCDAQLDAMALRDENAKLRELVRDMFMTFCTFRETAMTDREELEHSARFWKRLDELGIEVEG